MAGQEEAEKGALTNNGQKELSHVPVRFPSMICQWNKSRAEMPQSETLQPTPCPLDLGEHGPLRSTPSPPLTICSWRLGLPTFCKMAAAGREPGRGS